MIKQLIQNIIGSIQGISDHYLDQINEDYLTDPLRFHGLKIENELNSIFPSSIKCTHKC